MAQFLLYDNVTTELHCTALYNKLLYNGHCIMHRVPYKVHCANVHSPCILYSVQYTVQCSVHNIHCTMYSVQYRVWSPGTVIDATCQEWGCGVGRVATGCGKNIHLQSGRDESIKYLFRPAWAYSGRRRQHQSTGKELLLALATKLLDMDIPVTHYGLQNYRPRIFLKLALATYIPAGHILLTCSGHNTTGQGYS